MKKIKWIVLLILVVSMTLPFISCGNKITVRFTAVSPDGSVILDRTESVRKGGEISVPEVTPPEGYRFIGWILNGEVYDFSKEGAKKMSENVTFTASFEEKDEGLLQINYESEKTGKEVITYSVPLHDTSTLYENGRYYMCYEICNGTETRWRIKEGDLEKNRWGRDTLAVDFKKLASDYGMSLNDTRYNWAPDILKYNGKYYIFGTYWCDLEGHNNVYDGDWDGEDRPGHRSTVIFESDTITGLYRPITKLCTSRDTVLENDPEKIGHLTLAGKDTIDSTLYVDDDGQPWLVYCDEWTNYASKKGLVSAAKLSKDLTHLISEPKVLFSANAEGYSGVTDAPFIYKCENGDLLSLWSNFRLDTGSEKPLNDYAYCVLVSRNKSGKIDQGKWEFEYALYDGIAKTLSDRGHYGGHANIIMNSKGQLYLTLHIRYVDGSHSAYVPIHESNNRLVWGYDTVNKIVQDRTEDKSPKCVTKMAEGPFDQCTVEYTTQMDSDLFAGLYIETEDGWTGLKCNYESGTVIIENSEGKSEKYTVNVGYTKKVKFKYENLVGEDEFRILVNNVYSKELTDALSAMLEGKKIITLSFYSTWEGESAGNGVIASCSDYKVKGIRS